MLVLIEFNELCPSLLRRFMDEGSLPHFRRLYETSTVFTTDAQEAVGDLEPWVQWPTVHSGMTAAEHGKPVVLLPRKRSLGEHNNDHQADTAAWLRTRPGILVADTEADLAHLE